MNNYLITAGSTDVSVVIKIIDSTTGQSENGVVAATAGLVLQYRREGAANVSLATLTDLALLTTAHTDKGMILIGNGYYRVDVPDAAFSAGVSGVTIHGVATGMEVIGCYCQLTAVDLFDGVRGGMTALPNAAADAAGGLAVSDAGGLDLDSILNVAISTRATPAQVATELATYDGPTKAEMDAAHALLATPAQVATELATYDGPTKAEMDAAHALLATPAQVATELATYDGPTKAEMDAAHALLATEAKQDIIDTNIDTLLTRVTATLFSGITSMAEWLGLIAGKQVGDATARTELRATGAGSGTYDETTDSNEAIAGAGGGGAPTADQNAAAVWDKLKSAHTTAGTFGKAVSDIEVDTTTDIPATLAAQDASLISIQSDTASTSNNVSILLTRVTATLFSGITSMAEWLGLIAGKQVGDATARTELRATGAGSGAYDETTDSNEAIVDTGNAAWTTGAGGSPPELLLTTTIATLASQTSFTATAGSDDDAAYADHLAIVTDAVTATQKAVGTISAYTGSTKTITLEADPGVFTMAVGDTLQIVAAPTRIDAPVSTAGGATTILGPIVGVQDPGNRTGSPIDLEMFQHASKTFQLTVLDADGNGVDQSATTLRFVVQSNGDPAQAVFKIEDAAILRSGAVNEILSVTVLEADSATPARDYRWRLWDLTANDYVVQHGGLTIVPSVKDV